VPRGAKASSRQREAGVTNPAIQDKLDDLWRTLAFVEFALVYLSLPLPVYTSTRDRDSADEIPRSNTLNRIVNLRTAKTESDIPNKYHVSVLKKAFILIYFQLSSYEIRVN